MKYRLRKLSAEDGMDIYKMLQEIPKDDNGFINGCNGITFDEYKKWLSENEQISKAIGLEDWMVPQSIYWLYVDDIPVGYGKIRHYLTDKLRKDGGHIGYAVRPCEQNKGNGKLLLHCLVEEAKNLGIEKVLLTVQNHNEASIKVAAANGGVIENTDETKHYIWIDCS